MIDCILKKNPSHLFMHVCVLTLCFLRVFSVQQLDNVAVATENARRYFQGIQGDAGNKGELFGINNMFQLRTGDSCLTMEILDVREPEPE